MSIPNALSLPLLAALYQTLYVATEPVVEVAGLQNQRLGTHIRHCGGEGKRKAGKFLFSKIVQALRVRHEQIAQALLPAVHPLPPSAPQGDRRMGNIPGNQEPNLSQGAQVGATFGPVFLAESFTKEAHRSVPRGQPQAYSHRKLFLETQASWVKFPRRRNRSNIKVCILTEISSLPMQEVKEANSPLKGPACPVCNPRTHGDWTMLLNWGPSISRAISINSQLGEEDLTGTQHPPSTEPTDCMPAILTDTGLGTLELCVLGLSASEQCGWEQYPVPRPGLRDQPGR